MNDQSDDFGGVAAEERRKTAESKPKGAPKRATDRVLPDEYARLDLKKPVRTSDGGEATEIVIYRPTSRVMCEALDTPRVTVQIERFVKGCCRAVNGDGEPVTFVGDQLCMVDGNELAGIIGAMSEEADGVVIDEMGDGVETPIIYTLQRPITMSRSADAEVVRQFAFKAGTIRDVSEYLDAAGRGETREFHTFMRKFGEPLGVRSLMMTDSLINEIDWLDYLAIRRQIIPKFVAVQRRWRPAS